MATPDVNSQWRTCSGCFTNIREEKEAAIPVIAVDMWARRTIEQKRALARGLTEQFTKIGVPPEKVWKIFKNNEKENWAVGGELCGE